MEHAHTDMIIRMLINISNSYRGKTEKEFLSNSQYLTNISSGNKISTKANDLQKIANKSRYVVESANASGLEFKPRAVFIGYVDKKSESTRRLLSIASRVPLTDDSGMQVKSLIENLVKGVYSSQNAPAVIFEGLEETYNSLAPFFRDNGIEPRLTYSGLRKKFDNEAERFINRRNGKFDICRDFYPLMNILERYFGETYRMYEPNSEDMSQWIANGKDVIHVVPLQDIRTASVSLRAAAGRAKIYDLDSLSLVPCSIARYKK